MSVEIAHLPAECPPWRKCSEPTPVPWRVGIGGAAVVGGGTKGSPEVCLVGPGSSADHHDLLFVLIDLGGHRTLLYVLGDDPVYLDGQETLCDVLTATSPEQRFVIRSPRLAGAMVIMPARAIRAAAAGEGTCAYCGGVFSPGELVVTCGCSPQAVVHGADQGLDCWKRSACTSCGWPLADAEEETLQEASRGSA